MELTMKCSEGQFPEYGTANTKSLRDVYLKNSEKTTVLSQEDII